MQGIILAGGKGTRLKPHTAEIPKPLVSIDNKPIIEYLLVRMKKGGITRVHIAVNHLAHLIKAELGDGRQLGLEIKYSLEKKPLSTVAPLKLIKDLDDNFIVANGDILTDIDFRKLYEHHLKSKAKLTVATEKRLNKIDYGVITASPEGYVTSFREKPVYDFTVSMGIYVFSKSILDLVPDNEPFGFDHLMYKLLDINESINTYPFKGYWMDIGRPDDYEQAKKDIEKIKTLLD
ncbi:MAG: NDP-sugar synthase [Candidatus Zixiibacteriota bacterium]